MSSVESLSRINKAFGNIYVLKSMVIYSTLFDLFQGIFMGRKISVEPQLTVFSASEITAEPDIYIF